MAAAIEAGIPKLRIEEAAARTQARIDSGPPAGDRRQQVPARARRADRRAQGRQQRRCAPQQLAKLAPLRAERDEPACTDALDRLTAAGAGRDRRHAAAGARPEPPRSWRSTRPGRRPRSARSACALEKVFGRHTAAIRTISGVYRNEVGESPERREGPRARRRVRRARTAAGRASWSPRWARTATTAARRSSPPRSPTSASTSTSARCSRRRPRSPGRRSRPTCTSSASSSLAAGHLTLVPELRAELAALGRPDIMIVVGGVIPPQDFDALHAAGATAIFPPGTVIADAAVDLLDELDRAPRPADADEPTPRAVGDGPTVDVDAYERGCARRQPHGARPGDHARRVDASPTTERRAQELLVRLLPHAGRRAPRRHHRRARASASPRSSTPSARDLTGRGPPGGGARGRPVVEPDRRQHPRRQDAHGPPRRSTPTRSSARRRRRARSAASPRTTRETIVVSRPRATTSCSSRPSASASPRPRSRTWSTSSCCSCSPAPATSCRASRRACSSSPT